MKSMVGMALALAANYGLDVPNFRAKKLSRYPRNHVHTRDRESRRAKMQGLHNTPDGRIERHRGIVVVHTKKGKFVAFTGPNLDIRYSGSGNTRAEAIRAYRDLFLHLENQQ